MSGSFDWKWKKTGLTCPVTSVEFTGDLVLSGNGPFLSVYPVTSGVALESKCLLKRSRIHGIRVEPKCGNLVAIFGQRVTRIVRLERSGHNLDISLEPVTDTEPFPDLLWDVHWLYNRNSESDVTRVAIATAHNAIWCWDWVRNVKHAIARCEESCILYSARFFGCYLNNLVIASGTVFNQILLWKVHGVTNGVDRTKITHRLSGHEGVIFSINFNKTGTLLSSVSDDRSIRLWKISNLLTQESSSCIEPLLVVYGHTARVWDSRLLEKYFVSIGEDLVCNVWSFEGTLLKSYKGHTGRNIWSLAVNESEDLIVTGGGDGSIRLWPLRIPEHHHDSVMGEACLPHSTEKHGDKKHRRQNGKNDYPRFVSVLDLKTLLIMTNEGCLYKYNWLTDKNKGSSGNNRTSLTTECSNSSDTWRLLVQDKEYASYSVVSLSPCRTVIAFGNLQGRLKLQHLDFRYPHVEVEAYSGKVHSVVWSTQYSPQHLFSCGPDGQMTWWHVKLNPEEPSLSIHPLCSFALPPSKQRWASTVEIFVDPSLKPTSSEEKWTEEYLVVCGDRKGSLHLFNPAKAKDSASIEFIKPSHSLPSIHGKAGVSHVCVHSGRLYSAGRDGVYRLYNVQEKRLELVDTRKVFKGLDWVERLVFTVGGDLLIAGFHAAFFVLWSVQRNQLLWKVKCGGAHRAWDIFLQQLSPEVQGSFSEGVLSYIKGSRICTHKVTLHHELRNAVLKPSFHGREVTCICYIDSLRDEQGDTCDVFATGSEDTNINIMTTNRTTGVNSVLYSVHGHISSVRALSVTKCTSPKTQQEPANNLDKNWGSHLLFSGGGRASLKCWRVNLSLVEENDGSGTSSPPVAYLGEYSFRLSNHKRRRKMNNDHALAEIRFMSLTSLSASQLMDHSVSVDVMDRCQSLHFVMSACSDGFVRIFSFDTRLNKFFLMAQSQYLKRCVLTVTHLLERCVNAKPLVMLFAGGTAGKIFGWDISVLLFDYIEEYCEMSLTKKSYIVTGPPKEPNGYIQVDWPTEEMAIHNRGKDSMNVTHVHAKDVVTSDDIQEPVINSHAKENMTKEKIQKHVTDRHANDDVTKTYVSNVVLEAECQEVVTGATSETDRSKLRDILDIDEEVNVSFHDQKYPGKDSTLASCSSAIYQMLNTMCEDPAEFSCVPLMQCFLPSPSYEFNAHQSGVNAIVLVKMQEPGHYRLVSGGDDGALYTAEFHLVLTSGGFSGVHVTCEASLPSAHTSSVTAVKALKEGRVISSSVDQRLVLWEISCTDKVSFPANVFRQQASEFVDVADVQDLALWDDRGDGVMCAVCGVGLQTFRLEKSC